MANDRHRVISFVLISNVKFSTVL